MPERIDITGQRFGRLTILRDRDRQGRLLGDPKNRRVIARCDCGTERELSAKSIRRGSTTSCGCARLDAITKHGLSSHPLYNIHRAMLNRCHSTRSVSYRFYGAKGVRVCKAWHDPKVFMDWALSHGWRPGLTIDRINPKRGYSPANCRFITLAENVGRQDRVVRIRVAGQEMTLAEAALKYGIAAGTIYQRIKKLGWTHEEAVSV